MAILIKTGHRTLFNIDTPSHYWFGLTNKYMRKLKENFKKKKLIVFDLDGTLTESKADIASDMAKLFCRLLRVRQAAVIGGGGYEQFQRQFLKKLKCPGEYFKNLFIFPTTSTAFYRYQKNKWSLVYRQKISSTEKSKIFDAFQKTFSELHYVKPKRIYGKLIEDRGTQVTFSALGQRAPLRLKEKWKNDNTPLKLKIAKTLQRHLPSHEVRAAGFTSIDVTGKGIDKAYGLNQIKKHLGFKIKDMIFVGDALFPGGNDYAAKKTGVKCLSVSGPKETKKIIQFFFKN